MEWKSNEDYYLERLAEAYVYSQGDGPEWAENERRAVALQLQFMALSVTDIDGWKAAVEKARGN